MSILDTPGVTTYSDYSVFSLCDANVTVVVSGRQLVVSEIDVRLDKVYRHLLDAGRPIISSNWKLTLCTSDYSYVQDWLEYQQRLFAGPMWDYSTVYKRQLSVQVGDRALRAEGIWIKEANFSDGNAPGEIECFVSLCADHVHWTNAKQDITWDITLPK